MAALALQALTAPLAFTLATQGNMNSSIANMMHEPQKRHCSEHLNAEIDEECLIWLGKVFHVVITLGTIDEYIY